MPAEGKPTVFKRRTKRSWLTLIAHTFYPRGGWSRAFSYIGHRLRRLPDTPKKIARGIAAGVFVSFSPFFGFHFILAAIAAVFLRGNVLAAVLSTFFGNPLTFPLIATFNLELGHKILGRSAVYPLHGTVNAFADASVELWSNVAALFTADVTHWSSLEGFFNGVFLPYLVGGIGPGLVAGVVVYFLSYPVISAYQKLRRKKLRKKWAEMRARSDLKKADDKGDAA